MNNPKFEAGPEATAGHTEPSASPGGVAPTSPASHSDCGCESTQGGLCNAHWREVNGECPMCEGMCCDELEDARQRRDEALAQLAEMDALRDELAELKAENRQLVEIMKLQPTRWWRS